MQYLNKIQFRDIRDKYDYIIGWGTGSLFQMNYRTDYYPMDFLIDGAGRNIGKSYYGIYVFTPDKIKELSGKVLIVIYAIFESEILDLLENIGIQADTIIYNLLEVESSYGRMFPLWNGKHGDDLVLMELVRRLGLEKMQYMDIGVCHPIMRNNTYFLYEMGYQGVLVEPNPVFHKLIQKYRPNDRLLTCGAAVEDEELLYYSFPDGLGFNTFITSVAENRKRMGMDYKVNRIPVTNINKIISKHCKQYPNLLDVDVEGLDFELLEELNTDLFPIEIIMCETLGQEEKFNKLLFFKGYRLYAMVGENSIYVSRELNTSGLR